MLYNAPMTCLKPIKVKSGYIVSCGRCMSCRVNRRTELVTRAFLEYLVHGSAVFVTLTYSPEYLFEREKYPNGNLSKDEFQKFLKRFRKNWQTAYGYSANLRYFGVGEYGDKSQRAHYHFIFFGLPLDLVKPILEKSWKFGFTMVRDVKGRSSDLKDVFNSVRYTCGYTLKKMTHPDDFPDGRTPEFALWSKNPMLGYHGFQRIADYLRTAGMFPSRSIEVEERLHIRDEKIDIMLWDGTFYVDENMSINFPNMPVIKKFLGEDPDGKKFREYMKKFGTRMRLDTYSMKKLGQMVNPDLLDYLDGLRPMLEEKYIRVHKSRLKHQQLLGKIAFEGSEEHVKTKIVSERISSKGKSSKTIQI